MKSGYQYQEAYGGTGAGGYGAHYGGGAAAVQKHGYMQDVYDSETESESDESDCEEAHRLVTRYARLLISPHFVHGPVASVNSDPVASIPVRARQRMEKRHGKG